MEHVEAEYEALERIAENSKGDVRSAINDLQSLSEPNKLLTLQDTLTLSTRNKDISMEETLRGFFSAKSLAEAATLLSRSNADYDDFLLSVSDNLPRRYDDPKELAEAYDFVSRADVFRGRIGTEHWTLLRYFFNDMARAAAVSPESYKPFDFISPPIRIITLFWTKGKRTMLENICAKIGLQCHVSRVTAKNDFIPFLKAILEKNKTSSIISGFKLEDEEVEYLLKMNKF
jgi:replication factor C large subunit